MSNQYEMTEEMLRVASWAIDRTLRIECDGGLPILAKVSKMFHQILCELPRRPEKHFRWLDQEIGA
jgi:hypothetical protein